MRELVLSLRTFTQTVPVPLPITGSGSERTGLRSNRVFPEQEEKGKEGSCPFGPTDRGRRPVRRVRTSSKLLGETSPKTPM